MCFLRGGESSSHYGNPRRSPHESIRSSHLLCHVVINHHPWPQGVTVCTQISSGSFNSFLKNYSILIYLLENLLDQLAVVWCYRFRCYRVWAAGVQSHFATSFISQQNGPKSIQMLRNAPKYEFMVKCGGSCAFDYMGGASWQRLPSVWQA